VIGGLCGGCSDERDVEDAFAPRLERLVPFQYHADLIDEWPEQAPRPSALRAAEGPAAYIPERSRNSTASS
jgi:hypothetical protein